MILFYLQLRDFHEPLSLNHLLQSLFEHCVDRGMPVNIIGYKQKNSPREGAVPVGEGKANVKILDRAYQKKSNFVSRYLYECWLVIWAALHPKLWKGSDTCLVYSFPSSFLYIWISKVIFRKKIIYWIQDLWPENAAAIDAIKKSSMLYKAVYMLEKYAYRMADVIVPISEDIRSRLVDGGVPEAKLEVIHNWGYTDAAFSIVWEENQFVKLANLSKDIFYAVYAGNIGAVQNVEVIIEAAALLAKRPDIRFLVIGDGLALDTMKEKAKGLENVSFFPMCPPDMAYHIYSAASVNLVTLKKGIIYTALPSKTAVLLACGRPVAASLDTDSHYAALLQKYEVGRITEPEDAQGLADTIVQLADTPRGKRKAIMGGVRRCFEEHFSQEVAFSKFDKVFTSLGYRIDHGTLCDRR